jgi:hypothetical protein
MSELVLEQQNKRELADDKRPSFVKKGEDRVEAAKKKALKKAKKLATKRARQIALRWINVGFAATIVGIIVTYLIMSVQLFVGNLLGVESLKLEGWEIAIWALLTIILLAITILALLAVDIVMHPIAWASAIIWDWFKGN